MNRNSFKIFLITFAISCLSLPVSVFAIPTLGVAPGEPGSGGIYYGPTPGSSSYQMVFADTFIGGEDGFAMPSDGGKLSIWYGSNSGKLDLDNKIWLATTSSSGGDFTFTFNGIENKFVKDNNLAVAGYKEDVYGLELGSINNPKIGKWQPLTSGEFGSGKKQFWVLTGIIDYKDFLPGDWMYSAVANSPVSDFSPKTTSSTNPPTPVPEPATFLLFGTGIFGIAGWRRWRSKK